MRYIPSIHTTKMNRGFTMIELLVVIAIIGFLAAAVMASLQSAREKSYDVKITNDMNQIKNALELYAADNNFMYPDPQVSFLDDREEVTTDGFFANIFSIKKAYAQSQPGRNRNCIRFDNLSSVLVPNYIGAIPRHPLDDGINVCYQYYKSTNMNGGVGGGGGGGGISRAPVSVAYAPLVTQKYSAGNSKQIGIVLGSTEPEVLMEICSENLGETGTPFPLFTGPDHCSGEIADTVIGVTLGEGDVPLQESCSDPQYTNQEDCEADRSYCSDPAYTSAGQAVCESHGSSTNGYCIDQPDYTSQSACEDASYISSYAHCSEVGYSDMLSCVNARYISSPGHCSGGGYTDQASCEGPTYLVTPGTCDIGYPEDECFFYGGVWTPAVYAPMYTWTPEEYLYYNYQWIPDEYTDYGYIWQSGVFASNTWYYVPGGEWGHY